MEVVQSGQASIFSFIYQVVGGLNGSPQYVSIPDLSYGYTKILFSNVRNRHLLLVAIDGGYGGCLVAHTSDNTIENKGSSDAIVTNKNNEYTTNIYIEDYNIYVQTKASNVGSVK